MKHLLIASLSVCLSLFAFTQQAQAQVEEYVYLYEDDNMAMAIYFKFSGYQVEGWAMNSTNTAAHNWVAVDINYYDGESRITFTDAYGMVFHAELDPNNLSSMIVYNSDRTYSWRFWEQ